MPVMVIRRIERLNVALQPQRGPYLDLSQDDTRALGFKRFVQVRRWRGRWESATVGYDVTPQEKRILLTHSTHCEEASIVEAYVREVPWSRRT